MSDGDMKKPKRKNKRTYGNDVYKTWVENGKLEEVLKFISESAKRLVSQREMCETLKINPSTFSAMKKDHPDIAEAIDKAKFELKRDLASAMYKKAVGYEAVEEDSYIEDKGGKQVKKVHRVKKQIPPDYKAITYLLTKHFGKEYSERYEDLKLTEKKIEALKETWSKKKIDDEEDDNGES